ncbi:MAG: RluA family pseudouridine synthase [Chlamydiae bacterium]|nr:RluA family pseudouridine synthase [Chlamydiota bacterium]
MFPMNAHLLDILSSKLPDSSKNSLRELIKHRRVLVGDCLATHNIEVPPNQEVTILPKRKLIEGVTSLYADDHLVVVDKPEGLLSVATDFEEKKTLHAMLKKAYPSVWPVQRLDRETSGVMVYAISFAAKEDLKKQFMQHTIYREYEALVEGEFSGKGTWKHRLYEDSSYFMKVSPNEDGELAITHYQVIEAKRKVSRVRFVLETGKKNQIRVQTSYQGHPIIGDKKYGSGPSFLKRLALHAHKLEFVHPITKKKLSFTSPVPF